MIGGFEKHSSANHGAHDERDRWSESQPAVELRVGVRAGSTHPDSGRYDFTLEEIEVDEVYGAMRERPNASQWRPPRREGCPWKSMRREIRPCQHRMVCREDKREVWLPPRDSNPDNLLQRQVS